MEEVAGVRSSAGDMEPGGDGCSLGSLWGGPLLGVRVHGRRVEPAAMELCA